MVYFLWHRRHQMLKMGGTIRLRTRLKEQEVDGSDVVILLGVMEGEKGSEWSIQRYVKCWAEQYRNSDWFRPSKQLADFVNAYVMPALAFDWGRGASDDESPHSAVIFSHLIPQARVEWMKRLGRHTKVSWSQLMTKALRTYAKSVGFAEEMPDFPRPKRRRSRPLIKLDEQGRWWLRQEDGSYLPGFLEETTP
jgi:hypothetical protein